MAHFPSPCRWARFVNAGGNVPAGNRIGQGSRKGCKASVTGHGRDQDVVVYDPSAADGVLPSPGPMLAGVPPMLG